MRGRDQRGKENWLLIKADDEYATTEKGGAALLDAKPRSIKTGRTIADVAAGDVKIKRKPAPSAGEAKQTTHRRSGAGAAVKGAKMASLPSLFEPQLASLAIKPPVGESWVHEIKFDGYRLIARIDRGHAKLKTRNGLDWTTRFSSLKKALEGLPIITALLDGEVVAARHAAARRLRGDGRRQLHERRDDDVAFLDRGGGRIGGGSNGDAERICVSVRLGGTRRAEGDARLALLVREEAE